MTDQEASGLHTPQQRREQDPQPDPQPDQDRGESNEFLDQLAGRNVAETAYFDQADVDDLERVTPTDLYEGTTDANQDMQERGAERFDLLVEQELRAGETDDVMEAVEEGLTYIPPIDPPIVPDASTYESVRVAAGFAVSADQMDDDPLLVEEDHERALERGDDFTALVRHALLADSQTSHLVDRLAIATINGTVIVRGTVDDLDDTDNIVSVISDLPGVEAVRDETIVPGL